MGRGKQKAKQAKVARQLKYSSIDTDFAALQRELSVPHSAERDSGSADADDAEHRAPTMRGGMSVPGERARFAG
jgi:hypothetical protein